jgi:hypothetical protein
MPQMSGALPGPKPRPFVETANELTAGIDLDSLVNLGILLFAYVGLGFS